MRAIFLIAGATLTLAACGGGGGDEANTLTADNMLVNDGAMIDPMMNGDMNGMTADNMSMDANTQNAVEQDMTTNDADTNLANGM